ncbi:variable surface protein Vir28-like, partial [Plasmodium vivax]
MYDKMEKLYALYEKFKKFKDDNPLWNATSCSPVHSFLYPYNDFIRNNQPTNTHYKNILDEFRKEIKKITDPYNTYVCNNEYIHVENIENIKSPILPENEEPNASVHVQQPHSHAEHKNYQEIGRPSLSEPQILQARPQTSPELSQTYYQPPETPHAHPQSFHEGNQLSQDTLEHNVQHAVQQQEQELQHGAKPKTEFHVDVSQVYPSHYGSLEYPRTSSYSDQHPYSRVPLLANEVPGASTSVMSTITSALKGVDPVPVVGVSGGMGALFLLFRYTPVGAFFRGGRGRVRRIPSGFHGQFPGGFPGYDDYESGYIGYGPMNPLAE